MKSLTADKFKIARILLNLGHSYLNSTSLDNSDDEEEEEDDDEEEECKEKEEQNQQLDCKKEQIEAVEKTPKNIHENIEKKPQVKFKEEIQNFNEQNTQKKLNDKLKNEVINERLKHSYKDKQHELFNNVDLNEKEHEIEKKETQILDNSLQQALLNSNCRESYFSEPQGQSHNYFHLNLNGQNQNLQNDSQKEFDNEIQYNPDKISVLRCNKNKHNRIIGHKNKIRFKKRPCKIPYCIEKDNLKKNKLSSFNRAILDKFGTEKKQRFVNGLGIESQVNSDFLQELDKNEQDKFKEKHKTSEIHEKEKLEKDTLELNKDTLEFSKIVGTEQNIKNAKEIELNIQILVNSELNEKVQKEFDREKSYVPKMDIEIPLDIEIPKEFGKSVKVEYGVKQKSQEISEEFNKEKQVVEHQFNKEIQVDLEFQHKLDKNIKQNEFKKNTQIEFHKDISSYSQRPKYDCEIVLKEEKLKSEKLVEQFHRGIQEEIEQLICVVLYGEKNKSIQQCFTEKEQVELITLIQQEIEELQREIENSIQVDDEELEREIIEKISKTYFFSRQLQFFKNLIISFNQDSKPLNDRIKQLCNLYFQNTNEFLQTNNVEIPSNFEIGIQQQNNDEIYEFDTDKCINVDDSTLQTLNEETQKDLSNIQVDSQIENIIDDSVRSVVDKMKHEYYGEKQELQEDLFERKIPEKVLEEAQQVVNRDLKFKLPCKIETATQAKFGEEINEKNIEKTQQHFETVNNLDADLRPGFERNTLETFDKTVKLDLKENFDIVIQFTKGVKKKIDELFEQEVKGKLHVYFNEEIMKILEEESFHVAKNIQTFDKEDEQLGTGGMIQKMIKNKHQEMFYNKLICANDKEVYRNINGKIKQSIKDRLVESYDEIKQKVNKVQEINEKLFVEELQQNIKDETQVDFDGQIHTDVKEKKPSLNKDIQDVNEEIYLQLKFYKNIPQEVKGVPLEICESQLQNEFEMDVNKFKKKLLNRSEDVQELVGEDRDGFFELEELMQELLNQCEEEIEETSVTNTHKLGKKLQEGFEKETHENIQEIDEIGNINEQKHEESDVEIEDSEDETHVDFEVDIEELDDTIHREVIEPFNEINEVIEIVEEFEVKSASSIDDFIVTGNQHFSIENELSSSEEEFSSVDEGFHFTEENIFHEEVPQKVDLEKQDKYDGSIREPEERFKKCAKDTKQKFKREVQEKVNKKMQDLNEELRQEFEEPRSELERKNSYKFDGLQLEMGIEDIKDLDEVPLELKIKQEQFEEELHLQFKKFQKEFYTNLKIEYDKEQQLKNNKTFNPILSNVFDEQQQTFYELKDEFSEIKQEYKSYVQQKILEGLQREMDEAQLLEIEEFPEKFEDEPNLLINDDIHKEFVELQRDCYELESEFMYNVPFEFKEDNLSTSFNEKPLNLFQKLYSIHKKKLCDFVDSNQWPESCLYPSSLLDCLFENPLEDKPNVIVITLYSIDIGYSIKINVNKNESPVETFFNYADDTILEYIEQEQLPPHLLDLLDRAEPSLFYCGCIIAEIHDQINGIPGELYRILLRPFNMSIQSDLNQIIAENSHMNWSYNKKLKLESMLILASNPVMCMDSSLIAGLTVNLQHQLLSCRKIILNPLKYNFKSSKLNSSENNLPNDFSEDMLSTSKSSNKFQRVYSQSMDNTNTNKMYDLIWKFDFRIQSLKLIKLYILVVTDIQEHSMMLINSKDKSAMTLRFKINLKNNKLKSYINMILKILRNKINPDISVVRRHKTSGESKFHSIINVPILINDNIYEPSGAEINMLINKWLRNKSKYECYKSEIKQEEIKSPVVPVRLFENTHKIDKIKTCTKQDKKVGNRIDRSIHLCSTNKLSNKSIPNLEKEMSNVNLKEQNQQTESWNKLKKGSIFHRDESPLNPIEVNSSPSNSLLKPLNTILNYHSVSSPIEFTTSSGDQPFNHSPTLIVSLDNNDNGVNKELDSIPKQQSAKEMLPSISSPIIVTSNPPVSNLVTKVSSVSSPTYILGSVSNPNTLIPSVSSHIKSVFSINSNALSSEVSNTKFTLLSECLETKIDKNHVPRLEVHNINIDTELKPLFMLLNNDHSENVNKKNHNPPLNLRNRLSKQQLATLHDSMKTETGAMSTQSLNPQRAEKIVVVKHLHRDGICLSGPITLINKNETPPTSLVPKTSCVQQTTTNLQLDRRKKLKLGDMLLSPNLTSLSNLKKK